MDNSLDKKTKKDPLDELSGSGKRIPRTMRQVPRQIPGPGSSMDADTSNDLDGSGYGDLLKKDAPRRTMSGELESSLNWKTLDTVHMGHFDDFEDSESLMEDSFAGGSCASTQDSWVDDGEHAQFTSVDDEVPSEVGKAASSPVARKTTPRRTYSKQSKRMPKKVDPLMAISEGDNDSIES